MRPRSVVIGSGAAGLAAAATLAQGGHDVTVLEKNPAPGGRAGVWRSNGFTFDMGPSFYWMPDVFERFFARFGHRASDHFELRRLDPPTASSSHPATAGHCPQAQRPWRNCSSAKNPVRRRRWSASCVRLRAPMRSE
ncbi:MAG: FAD-dependent oxidoreductase [Flavobacteriales bacterium]